VKYLVYGLARSGVAAGEALERRGHDVVRADRTLGNEDDLSLLDGVDVLVKNPGVPGERPLVAAARERGIPVWSEVELGWSLHPERPIVGVTGTNGKSTTVELLGAIFRAAGRDVAVAGNIGRPLSAVEDADLVICELSSFQLEDVHELRLRVAVLLNLEPDHLDRHVTFEAYRDAKLRIFERADAAIVPRGLELPGTEFSSADPLPAEPLIPGAHNRENAAAATAAARAAGIGDEAIAQGLRTFPGVPHRLETVGEVDGVRYVNDSKATNVAATLRGLAAYPDAFVILGGSLKGESFAPLEPFVRRAFLVGEASDQLEAALGARTVRAGTLARAVELAAAEAKPGDVVLLSPACASYDQYANFEERGEDFRRLVANLSE
jgi:UDP-N-acetylmuramoylalanine--D-glutamate ligase